MTNKKTVLIIDDDEEQRLLMSRFLSNAGYGVLEAASGKSGLEILAGNAVDCVLLDYFMPDENGPEVARNIRAGKGQANVPILMLTAFEQNDDTIMAALSAGADDFFSKSRDMRILISRINVVLGFNELKNKLKETGRAMEASNEKLKKLHGIRDDFIFSVSREMSTPLAIVKEGINIILDGTAGVLNPEQHKFLDSANRNVERLTAIINDLMTLTRVESGRLALCYDTISPKEFIDDLIRSFGLISSEKNINLQSDLGQDVDPINADVRRLFQVFTNLIGNALKFTPQGGTITIGAHNENNFIIIWVRDTGRGIPPGDLEHIFEKIHTANRAGGYSYKGTGLGLAISKKLVEAHGGNIRIESREGEGTCVYVKIPKDKNDEILFYEFFRRCIESSIKNGLKFCTIELVCENWHSFDKKYSQDVLHDFFSSVIKIVKDNIIRPNDKVFDLEDGRVMILLPRTHREGGDTVTNRVLAALNGSFPSKEGLPVLFKAYLNEYPRGVSSVDFDMSLLSLLLVMNDENLIRLVSLVTEKTNVDLHVARTEAEALEMSRMNRYNAVIMDEEVVKTLDDEMLARMRKIKGFHALCIYLAGKASHDKLKNASEKGFFKVLTKPLTMQKIEKMLLDIYREERSSR